MKIKKFYPFLILLGLSVLFYWKYFFKGWVPFPGDLLVGAYYPWLDYKWGNVVGVAVKNTFISDIFSEFFVEKSNIASAIASGQWPVWDPSYYSGFPLYSSYNTGALNPFNLLMVFFGNINGWSLLVFSQPLLSSIFMYVFLHKITNDKYASILGSIVYSFGGFAMTWSQYVNAGFVMVWIPLIFYILECAKKDTRRIFFISPFLFLVVSAGHFQGLVYTAFLSLLYFVYSFGVKNIKPYLYFFTAGAISLGLSSVQLLPTIELLNRSVRFEDGLAASINFGLLPMQNIITMIAPDFFGNHSTGNFWGFYNYHETITYSSIIGFIALSWGVYTYKKRTRTEKFFIILVIIAVLLQFNSPLGTSIYKFYIPFISTSVAGRIGMVYLFGVSAIVSFFIKNIHNLKTKGALKILVPSIFIWALAFGLAFLGKNYGGWLEIKGIHLNTLIPDIEKNAVVAVRNLILPLALIVLTGGAILLTVKEKKFRYLLFAIIVFDLFRFGWKYLPFVPQKYIFPRTEVTDFIKKDKSIFRIDKERGEIMPPNTWMGYNFQSPSGFDPLAIAEYVRSYKRDLNNQTDNGVSRYSELKLYNAKSLGEYNVKYLLAIKRDDKRRIPGDIVNSLIYLSDWDRVFETKSVVILKNKFLKPRARIVDSNGDDAKGEAVIKTYKNNKVVIEFKNHDGTNLLLADTYFPGWIATINGERVKIEKAIDKPFRSVHIEKDSQGIVVFEYKPRSFYLGLRLAEGSALIWILTLFFVYKDTCYFSKRYKKKG